jgi:Uri superfamily endonuclease
MNPNEPLPDKKGTYILIARLSQLKRLEIGSLGEFDILPGFYAYVYVGSAFGFGGLRGRIGHHLESTAEPHWHIDYLLQAAIPVEVWFTTADRKLERHWAELLEDAPGFRAPISRFGSSDYHRSRASHLFHSKRRPSFRWFQDLVRESFEEVEVERYRGWSPREESGFPNVGRTGYKGPDEIRFL